MIYFKAFFHLFHSENLLNSLHAFKLVTDEGNHLQFGISFVFSFIKVWVLLHHTVCRLDIGCLHQNQKPITSGWLEFVLFVSPSLLNSRWRPYLPPFLRTIWQPTFSIRSCSFKCRISCNFKPVNHTIFKAPNCNF